MVERVAGAHGEPAHRPVPQAPSLWISELWRDPPPILVLTPKVEVLVATVMTSTLVITASSLAISYCPASI